MALVEMLLCALGEREAFPFMECDYEDTWLERRWRRGGVRLRCRCLNCQHLLVHLL